MWFSYGGSQEKTQRRGKMATVWPVGRNDPDFPNWEFSGDDYNYRKVKVKLIRTCTFQEQAARSSAEQKPPEPQMLEFGEAPVKHRRVASAPQ